ncbi:MAG: SRPBCC family protein [Kofleriaceae bacterium]
MYADAARLERERNRLFRDYPLAVGHVAQLAAPGDFFTHDAAGVPLLITRGDDKKIRAFLNVCRHRGTRVEPTACGARKAFVCPYHAWTYGRDGKLLGIPHAGGFVGIPYETRGLAEVPVAVHAGLIFVQPGGGAMPAEWLGAITRDLEGFGTATAAVYGAVSMTRELSWKLGIDVFLESYHLRPTHRASIYPLFFDNVGLVDPIGPHLRNVFPKRTIRELAALPEKQWSLRQHANVLFHIFPNTLVLVEPDHCAVLHLWPQGPARTLLTAYMLVPDATVHKSGERRVRSSAEGDAKVDDKARAYWDANNKILLAAVEEDFVMGESIQRGITSGANREITFGAFEHALAHFHRQIEQLSQPS